MGSEDVANSVFHQCFIRREGGFWSDTGSGALERMHVLGSRERYKSECELRGQPWRGGIEGERQRYKLIEKAIESSFQ